MSVLATKWPTLLDVARGRDPDGQVAAVAELLTQKAPILQQMPWKEGNMETGHRSVVRTGLPTPTWRKLYGGVQPTKSTKVPVVDTCGMLEDYAEVDKALADQNGNTAAFRLSEDSAHIAGMANTLSSAFFYSNEATAPEQITGLGPRYNSLSAQNADNIVDHGGSGTDNTSIWLVVWGDDVHGIYPKGSHAGLQVTDKGQVTVENVDGSNGRAEMYRTHYRQDAGLVVKDWRQVVRICNIDVSDLTTIANTKAIINSMVQAAELVNDLGAGRPVFYMNRNTRMRLRLGILERIASNLTWETVAGKRVMMFDEIPVERVDAILNTEARIT